MADITENMVVPTSGSLLFNVESLALGTIVCCPSLLQISGRREKPLGANVCFAIATGGDKNS
jgi:hypothetical protein